MVNATTLARVKAHLDITVSAQDSILTALLGSVSKEIEAFIGYPLEQTSRTEYHTVKLHDEVVFLDVIPVASITSVKVGPSYWDFASLDALTADQDYRMLNRGMLHLNLDLRHAVGKHKVQVVYTAGLGADETAVVTAAPDLALAAEIQVGEEWRRRANPTTVSIPTPKGAKTVESPHRLIPRVRELLFPYRRLIVV